MSSRISSYIKLLVAFSLIASFCLVEAGAQTRKKKRTRRSTPVAPKPVITNPPIAPAETTQGDGDVKIISTADGTQDPTETDPTAKPKPTSSPEGENMQQTITSLSNQVNKLNEKLGKMQEDDRYQLDMERLTRAEQRAEQLRSQLMDVQSKIADFEARIELIDYSLKPENIESSMAAYGSTRPEQARETRRKQLEGEKARVVAQMKLAENSRTRLETAVTNADSEVDLLRAKLQQRRDQMDAAPAPSPETPPKPRKP